MADPVGAPVAGAALQGNEQNIFEHAAENAQGLPDRAGPAQLGAHVLDSMQGYVARATTLAERSAPATGLPDGGRSLVTPAALGPDAHLPPAEGSTTEASPSAASDEKMGRVIDSLGMMFDHAIETQMVVRGSTQLAGAANTLLKGQ